MVMLAQRCSRPVLLSIVCVSVVFMLCIMQNDLEEKESNVANIITRPQQLRAIFFSDNERNQPHNAANMLTYMSTVNVSESSILYRKYLATEPQDDKHEQMKDVIDEHFLREREKVFSERRLRMKEVCKQYGDDVSYGSVSATPLHRLRWLNSRKLIMCFNAKVGTSTWSNYLLELAAPKKSARNIHFFASKFLLPIYSRRSPKTLTMMKEFSKVISVRHPFARIVSAYYDKIVRLKIKRVIKRIKLQRLPASSSKSAIPTFEEFVKYLINDVPSKYNIIRKVHSVSNIHWMPYYANCAPCDIHYDIIMKMETMNEDTRYVNHRFRLGIKEYTWQNHNAPNSSEVSSITLFKKLPRNLILGLYQRYRIDFDLFGYSLSPYLTEI